MCCASLIDNVFCKTLDHKVTVFMEKAATGNDPNHVGRRPAGRTRDHHRPNCALLDAQGRLVVRQQITP